MPLTSGVRLGPYEIITPLGAGGMGEVYRARDTKLLRDVAIEILPELFADDADRFARFTREAHTLAALNHPNIAQIYGLEEHGGVRALVMELVDGQDLSTLIVIGQKTRADGSPGSRPKEREAPQARESGAPRGLGLDDSLAIARQIAEALETAHEQGIVHRDLKPANVKVRPDGTVKVIDFGLAKASGPDGRAATANPANSPTMTAAATERGLILGTAAYMAPEQARGQAVDKRADIWAFGVVLYEMLTGTRAFGGDGFTDVLAAVLRQEIDWSKLPSDTPPRVRQLLERCLERDVKQRLRDIGEARVTLAAVARGGPEAGADISGTPRAHPGSRPPQFTYVLWSAVALAVLTAAAIFALQLLGVIGPASSSSVATDVVRLSVLPPPGLAVNPDSANVSISPDGRMVAFVVGAGPSAENQLWVRALDSPTARRIESGDGVAQPFWSPDNERIGFFADRKLKTVAAAGGPALVVCEAPFGRGASWSPANVIVFAPDANGPLYRVSAVGGTPAVLTALDQARNETGHRFPYFLPDGDHFLFAALPGSDGAFEIFAGSLRDAGARTLIGKMENAPAYAAPGWLLFTRGGLLQAQPFDVKALRTTGDAISLGDEPGVAPGSAAYDGGRRVSPSASGSLAYVPDPAGDTNVQWMDQTGKLREIVNVPAGRYTAVAIAPDSARAVLVRRDSATSSRMWLADLTRASAVPLSVDSGREPSPTWSSDSRRIVFMSDRDGHNDFYETTIADASPERRIFQSRDRSALPRNWSGSDILFNQIDPGTKWNIYRLPASGAADPVPVVRGPAIEVGGWLSPDGHWLAYQSDETGRLDLFVQSFPAGGARQQIPTGGSQLCWWARDGKHLLFLKRDQTLWRVDLDLSATTPHVGVPQQIGTFPRSLVTMDLAPDGQRFLAIVSEHAGVGTVTIVQSWRAALTKH